MAGKKKDVPSGLVSLDSVLENVEREYPGSVRLVPEATIVRIDRIPIGIFSLDAALGGGVPVGRMSLFSGEKNTGKSTIALRALGHWQQHCHKCWRLRNDSELGAMVVAAGGGATTWTDLCQCKEPTRYLGYWSDVEGVFDEDWAVACGVDVSILRVDRPKTAEEAIDKFMGFLETDLIGFMVMDSIAALLPEVELEKSASDLQQAEGAKKVNKFMRQISGVMNMAKSFGVAKTLVMLNQLRQKLGVMTRFPQFTEPNGLAQTYTSSVWVRFKWRGYEWDGVKEGAHPPAGRRPDRSKSQFAVRASKVGPPGIEGEFHLCLRSGEHFRIADSSDLDEVIKAGKDVRLILRRGGGLELSIDDGERSPLRPRRFADEDELRMALLSDRWLLQATKNRVVESMYKVV